jgi:hypothetical protein
MKRSVLDVTSCGDVGGIRETVETRWVGGRRRFFWLRAGTSLLLTLVALVLAPPPAAQAREPDVLECQQHAAGLLPSTLVSANRLRRANLLPDRVSVDGGLTSDRDHRDESTWTEDVVSGELLGDGTMRENLRGDWGVRWQAGIRVEWRLTGLVYDDDELPLARESARLEAERVHAMHEVATAWHGRQQALLAARRASELGRPADVEVALLEARHFAAILDAWTGGWFTEVLGEEAEGSVDSRLPPD